MHLPRRWSFKQYQQGKDKWNLPVIHTWRNIKHNLCPWCNVFNVNYKGGKFKTKDGYQKTNASRRVKFLQASIVIKIQVLSKLKVEYWQEYSAGMVEKIDNCFKHCKIVKRFAVEVLPLKEMILLWIPKDLCAWATRGDIMVLKKDCC